MAMGPVGPARVLAADKGAADIERGLMLTSARERLFFWVVPSATTVYRTTTNKPAIGRVVSVAKTAGELRDEIVVAEGTQVVGLAADERSLYWVETSESDPRVHLRTRAIDGGEARELATFDSAINFNDLQARDGVLVWQNLALGSGRKSSVMRLVQQRRETVFEGTLAVAAAPNGVVVAQHRRVRRGSRAAVDPEMNDPPF